MAIEKFKLSYEDQSKLEAMTDDIKTLTEEIDRAKRVGIDVTKLKENLDRVIKLRDGLLSEYT